jgi:hypothetical protein
MTWPARVHVLLALALWLSPARARAEDAYPTIPDDQDYLCQSIAGSAPSLVSPQDRLWFRKTCTCSEAGVCGRPGSKRYAVRVKAVPADVQAQREAAARVSAWRRSALQATERLRQAYRDCRASRKDCEIQLNALEEGCNLAGLLTWDECMARE